MTVRCFLIFVFFPGVCLSQQIVDSCFISIATPGRYDGSADLQNTCWNCYPKSLASDLMEWDIDSEVWRGKLPNNPTADLPPPPGSCLTRALWMGKSGWTGEGEGVALRLTAPLNSGTRYTYTFTYAADGAYSEAGFAPIIFTNVNYSPQASKSVVVDTLPRVMNSWETHELSFVATDKQDGHNWIILLAWDGSGTLLSDCKKNNPFKERFFPSDTVLCGGDELTLEVPAGENVIQEWSDGTMESSLSVDLPGSYSVEASYYNCVQHDTIEVIGRDCEVRLVMPNVFTPNDDQLNMVFRPMETNFVQEGTLTIINRWGERVYRGDIFKGWDGFVNGREAASGTYFYKVDFRDEKNLRYRRNGLVSLLR